MEVLENIFFPTLIEMKAKIKVYKKEDNLQIKKFY